jgi:hypothetical protein
MTFRIATRDLHTDIDTFERKQGIFQLSRVLLELIQLTYFDIMPICTLGYSNVLETWGCSNGT